jgi:hypothetical protein
MSAGERGRIEERQASFGYVQAEGMERGSNGVKLTG